MKFTHRYTQIGAFLCVLFNSPIYAKDRLLDYQEQAQFIYYLIPLLFLALIAFIFSKVMMLRKPSKQLGFLSITPHRPQRYFALDDTVENMVPVVDCLADEKTNVYSNLNKITLTIKPNGVFLEDKNYKISILINRRRSRRSFLDDGDILDMGELTIMYKSPFTNEKKYESKNRSSGKGIPRSRRVHGKVLPGCARLIPLESREKTYYLTKNVVFIGRSEMNDLVPKSKAVSPIHSRIEKVAGKYKLVDLNSQNGTFVNGRRVDNKFLHDGDEVSFESVKYTFTTSNRAH